MGFNPTWDEFWDYFQGLDEQQRKEMLPELERLIKDASPGMYTVMMKSAPQEVQLLFVEAKPQHAPASDEQIQAAVAEIYSKLGMEHRVQSKADLRKNGRNSNRENGYIMRRIAYFFGRGFIGRVR